MFLISFLLIFADNPAIQPSALPDIGTAFLRMLLWLGVIVALLIGSYFFLKRTFKGRLPNSRTKSIEVIEKIPLFDSSEGKGCSLCRVSAGD
jgi:hypothetical protein